MKWHPILFKPEMAAAIRAGRKTMTRRLVDIDPSVKCWKSVIGTTDYRYKSKGKEGTGRVEPRYAVGDGLWIRETWGWIDGPIGSGWYVHKADYEGQRPDRWRPSIHMPKEACKTFLIVEDVNIERIQNITEEDAIAEGVERIDTESEMGYRSYMLPDWKSHGVYPYVSFKTLWQKINGLDSWENNPWVWAYSFKEIDQPEIF